MAPQEQDPLVGTIVDGRYRILSRVAAGGMGIIYRAEQVFLKREVALKRLHRELTGHGQAMARFKREAQAAVKINHPNVCQVLDCGVGGDGALFIAMELLEGQSLAQRVADYAPLPLDEIVEIGAQVCEGLGQAHALGIVHRDLKPENVMLVPRPDGSGVTAKIMDFGVAKVSHDVDGKALTQAGMIFGTPKYMAPEQASGETLDARADLYSLGVMLFEMATGRPPFDAPTMSGLLTKHLTEPPPTLEAAAPHLAYPLPFREIVARCLIKDPGRRIPSAQALGDALRACAGQRASLVGPPLPRPSHDDAPTVLAGGDAKTPLYIPEPPTTGFGQLSVPSAAPPVGRHRSGPIVVAAVALGLVGLAVAVMLVAQSGPEDDRRPPAPDAGTAAVARSDAPVPEPHEAGIPGSADRPDVAVGRAEAVASPDAAAAEMAERPDVLEEPGAPDGPPPTRQALAAAVAEERRAFESREARVLQALARAAQGKVRAAIEQLRALSGELDGDAHYHFELAVLLLRDAQPAEAIQHALRALGIDPRYASDADLHGVAERCLLTPASAEAAALFVDQVVDPALAERLVKFVLENTRSVATPLRVRDLLVRRGLLDGVPAWLRLPLLVIATEDCAARRAVLEEITAGPDPRMAPYLVRFHGETGCGRRRRGDCWPCERSALRAAIAAVDAAPSQVGTLADAGAAAESRP